MYQAIAILLGVTLLADFGQSGILDTKPVVKDVRKEANRPLQESYVRNTRERTRDNQPYVTWDVFNETTAEVLSALNALDAMMNKAITQGTTAITETNTRVSSLEIDNCAVNPCINGGTCHSLIGDSFCKCPANKAGSKCEIDIGSQIALPYLVVNNGGPWGTWHFFEFCPSGSFAAGFRLKLEAETHDDSEGNAVELLCKDLQTKKETADITSGIGAYGVWQAWQYCSEDYYLVQFKLKVEAEHGGDESAMNGIHMVCRGPGLQGTETEELEGPLGPYGTFGEYSNPCPSGLAICGISTKIEAPVNDDSAMNDVKFQCCYV